MDQIVNLNEYEISVDYDPKKHDLVKTLEGFALVIKGELQVSRILSNLVDESICYSIELQNITIGSVTAIIKKIFKNTLCNTENEQIKDKGYIAFVNQFMIEAKEEIVEYIHKKEQINYADIKAIKGEIINTAKEIGIQNTIRIENISDREVLDCLDGLTAPAKVLQPEQKVSFNYGTQKRTVNKEIAYERSKIVEAIEIEKSFDNQSITISIKKPDYVGKSKWEVIYNNEILSAKILDEEWLAQFQHGFLSEDQIPLPTDTIEAIATILIRTNSQGTQIHKELEIIKIKKVIKGHHQNNLDV